MPVPNNGYNLYTLKEGVWNAKVYLKPNSNWTQSNAWFAAYFFGNGEHWVGMTANGDVYEGSWEDDAMNGAGVLRMADGRRYAGGFVEGLEHGAGVATDVDGTRYEGVFVEGQRNGGFIVKDADGNVIRECEYNLGIIA